MTLKEEIMQHHYIYSFLYGQVVVDYNLNSEHNAIIIIKTKDLSWSIDGEEAYYTWGYPGSDYNAYNRKSFGKGWAYDRETLEEYLRKRSQL